MSDDEVVASDVPLRYLFCYYRLDRDDYVTVIEENVIPGYLNNFKKYNGETFGLPYDYG